MDLFDDRVLTVGFVCGHDVEVGGGEERVERQVSNKAP